MQVTRDHDLGAEPRVPVLSSLSPAPEAEPRHLGDVHEVLAQGPMIHKHVGQALGILRREPPLPARDERLAPRVARGVGVRVQEELVGSHSIGLLSPLEGALARNMGRAEAIVIKRK